MQNWSEVELEKAIIYKVLKYPEQLTQLRMNRCTKESFEELPTLWSYVLDFYDENQEMPTVTFLKESELFDEEDLKFKSLKTYTYSAATYWKFLMKQRMVGAFSGIAGDIGDAYDEGLVNPDNIETLVDLVGDKLTRLSQDLSISQKRPSILAEYKDITIDEFKLAKKGERPGIENYFPDLNSKIGPWPPGTLNIIVGSSSVGKTWAAMLQTKHSLEHNRRVLFISYELSRKFIARRLFALLSQAPYGDFTRGTLNSKLEKQVLKKISSDKLSRNCMIAEPGTFPDVASAAQAAQDFGAELIIGDSYYEAAAGSGSQERWSEIARLSSLWKTQSSKLSVPVILTHQFNRNMTGTFSSAVRKNIMGSFDIINPADNLVFLVQPPGYKERKRLFLKVEKGRESDTSKVGEYLWDPSKTSFKFLSERAAEVGLAGQDGSKGL